ncbi:riboflavin biosynthesis protein RibD, partial [Acinetobacter baumannii]
KSARAMFNAEFEYMAEQLRFTLLDVTKIDQDIRLRLIPTQEKV